jgi:hypothetical protein
LNLFEVRGAFGIWNILVASPFGLRSGLRQSGSAFGAAFYGMRERMPFPFQLCIGPWVNVCLSVLASH